MHKLPQLDSVRPEAEPPVAEAANAAENQLWNTVQQQLKATVPHLTDLGIKIALAAPLLAAIDPDTWGGGGRVGC
jgi:hypothetical protein